MTISLSIPLWILSAFPIVFLIGVMVARMPGLQAAPVTLCITIVSAVVFFRMNLPAVAVESGKGIWSAVSILLVVWPALLLYELSTQVQAFQVLLQEPGPLYRPQADADCAPGLDLSKLFAGDHRLWRCGGGWGPAAGQHRRCSAVVCCHCPSVPFLGRDVRHAGDCLAGAADPGKCVRGHCGYGRFDCMYFDLAVQFCGRGAAGLVLWERGLL